MILTYDSKPILFFVIKDNNLIQVVGEFFTLLTTISPQVEPPTKITSFWKFQMNNTMTCQTKVKPRHTHLPTPRCTLLFELSYSFVYF